MNGDTYLVAALDAEGNVNELTLYEGDLSWQGTPMGIGAYDISRLGRELVRFAERGRSEEPESFRFTHPKGGLRDRLTGGGV